MGAPQPPPPPEAPLSLVARLAAGSVGLVLLGAAVWAWDGGIEGVWVDAVAAVVGFAGLSVIGAAFRA